MYNKLLSNLTDCIKGNVYLKTFKVNAWKNWNAYKKFLNDVGMSDYVK